MFAVSASGLCKWLFVLIAFASLCSDLSADQFSYRLAPDGSWVRYDVHIKGTMKMAYPPGINVPDAVRNAPPLPVETNGSLTLRSVGTEQVNGEQARWLELHFDVEILGKIPTAEKPSGIEQKGQRQIVLKMLIPQKYFVAEEDPFANVSRLYIRDGKREPMLVDDEKRKQYEIDRFRTVIPKPAANVSTTANQVLSTSHKELGHLTCEKLAFDSTYEGPLTGGQRGWWSWAGTHQVWLNDRVPFGIAAVQLESTSHEWNGKKKGEGLKVTVEGIHRIVVSDFGLGAVSILPNSN